MAIQTLAQTPLLRPLARPHVVHLVQTLSGGGAESAVRLLCAGLPDEGVRTSVISVYGSGLDVAAARALGVPLFDLGRRGRGDYSYFPTLVGRLRALRPDLVHAHLHTGQYPGRVAALLACVPSIVLTIHGREPGGPVRRAFDALLHPRTARFVVFTEAQRQRFASEQNVPPERIVVIPNGARSLPAPASRFDMRRALGIPQEAFALYAIGRFSEEKNHAALLDGFAAAVAGGADRLHLVLAGAGPLEAELKARAAALHIAARVHFLGFRGDATALCSAMDLFVLSSFREAMPLALGEAMLGGLAPLVTPWRDHDAFVRDGENGYVARDFSAAGIADAIERALTDPARPTLAARAREGAERMFDPGAMVAAHAELYRTLKFEARRAP